MTIKTALGLSLITIAAMLAYSIVTVILSYPWLLLIPGVMAGAITGWFVYNWAAAIRERRLLLRAQRKQQEHITQVDDFGMLHLINIITGHSQNLTLDARTYRNGHAEPSSPQELETLRYLLASRHAGSARAVISEPSQLLPAPQTQLDFFRALQDPLQAYAIIGPQRIGKSVLIQQLTSRFISWNQRCVVIGTKAGQNEWQGCERYIGGPSDSIVPDALDRLYQESEQRIGQHVNTPLVAIVLDDWLNTAELWPEIAERFFVEAATRMLTAGFVPYFILQSDSKSDWGIKHGAQLKNNFTHLFLSAPRHSGQIDHSQLKASIIYPGDKQQHPVQLPYQHQVILQPTRQEQLVISLHEAGASMNEIARQAFGGVGGNQNRQIRDILAKYGYVSA